jgi:hypothetical protein
MTQPRYSMEEFARRGDALYESKIGPLVEPGNKGKFVVIDIETGEYEVDEDELKASDRLLKRVPTAQMWLRRIGFRYARHFLGLSRRVPPGGAEKKSVRKYLRPGNSICRGRRMPFGGQRTCRPAR